MSLQADLLQPELGFFEGANNLTDPETYACNRLPFGKADGLPPFAYRSKVFSELENEKIWTRSWVPIGLAHQIPNPGDLLPFTLGFQGVHIQRMKDGSIESRFNRHQHGGCRFVPEQCRTGKQTKCTIASCNYTRDAHVLPGQDNGDDTPEMYKFVGINPDKLIPVPSEGWGPFVFINLDPQAVPLSGVLPEALRSVIASGHDELRLTDHKWLDFKCNWKLFGAAFVAVGVGDAQHGTCASTEDPANVIATVADGRAMGMEQGGARIDLVWMFPNLLVARSGSEIVVVVMQATGMGDTLARVSLLTSRPDDGLGQPKLASFWEGALGAIAARAEAAHDQVVKWGTSSLPETMGKAPGTETCPAKYAIEQYVLRKILAVHELHWSAPIMDARMMQRRGSQ